MKLTLNDKTYTSPKATMGMIRRLVALNDLINKREKVIKSGTEDEQNKLIETLHPLDDIDNNVALIVEYFGKQFTAQEFMDGYTVESIQDFYVLVYNLIAEAVFGVTTAVGGEKK